MRRHLATILTLALCAACISPAPPVEPDPYATGARDAAANVAAPVGSEIVICGQRFDIGAPVVLWTDAGGYDAYDRAIREGSSPDYASDEGQRYRPGRRADPARGKPPVSAASSSPADLVGLDQFVLHYDVCGTSRTCFEVLHHLRGLSVHFLLDIDGTLYQTMDLRETGWHATRSNTRSVGVEIAHIGARTAAEFGALDEWYGRDEHGLRLTLPARFGDGGVRTQGFVGRPARDGAIEGVINGTPLVMYDFTGEQYTTLEALLRVLVRELPALEARFPRDATGAVDPNVLSDEAFERFAGILAHWHVQQNKTDPGPAFDWERVGRAVGAR